jgi:2-polyprenyl-3-methyl-5-hydroxy-6-metoxy-1,4-benzoquinol methylase
MMGVALMVKGISKNMLAICGLEVHRKVRRSRVPNAQGMLIESALQHNTLEKGNEYYSNPRYWKTYLDKEGYRFYDDFIRLLKEKGIDCTGKHILDAGCGTGHLLLAIAKEYQIASLTGFEIVPAALKIARETVPQADIRNYDIEKPYTGKRFDVLFCTEVLEHILVADEAVRHLITMLNNPGIAVITVPNGRKDTFAGHLNYWSPESWDFFMKKIGGGSCVETGTMLKNSKNFAILKNI